MNEKNKTIRIFDQEKLISEINALKNNSSAYYSDIDDLPVNHYERDNELSAESKTRLIALMKIISEENASWREPLIVNPVMVEKIKTFLSSIPNFKEVSSIINAAASLSNFAGSQLKLPPILLLGNPGVGKTRYTKNIAKLLQTSYTPISINLMTDTTSITGSTVSWRGAHPGKITKALLECKTASPVVIMDEIDKFNGSGNSGSEQLYDALHSLFDEENSTSLIDEYYDIAFNASHVIYMATANKTDNIPNSLLDRMEIIQVKDPTFEEKRMIIQSMFDNAQNQNNNAFEPVSEDILNLIAETDTKLRRANRIITRAMGLAAQDSSKKITEYHVKQAINMSNDIEKKNGIGFLSSIK